MKQEEQLLEEIAGFLHTYLKAGTVSLNTFLAKANVNIENLKQLLTIRFLLKEETMSFVENLPRLLNRFKTTTTFKNEVHVGEVRGAINWPETTKSRLAQNYKDPLIFSTTENIRSYETQENLVLKQVLSLLFNVLEDDYIKGFEKADWFGKWQHLKPVLRHALIKNIYLQRVPLGQVSNRMIMQTCQHRNPLYRSAAHLLAEYRKLMRGDYTQEELEYLLRETFIIPENIDVLFELYWVIQLLKTNTDTSKLYLLDGTQKNVVATWDKDHYTYHLYHDSAGSEQIDFRVARSEIINSNNPYLQQVSQSFDTANELATQLFNQRYRQTYRRGQPDFLVEVREKDNDQLVRIIIGEVKNTIQQNYVITGLRELLDYIYLVKDSKGDYLLNKIPVRGILCVGDVAWNEQTDSTDLVELVNRGDRDGLVI